MFTFIRLFRARRSWRCISVTLAELRFLLITLERPASTFHKTMQDWEKQPWISNTIQNTQCPGMVRGVDLGSRAPVGKGEFLAHL